MESFHLTINILNAYGGKGGHWKGRDFPLMIRNITKALTRRKKERGSLLFCILLGEKEKKKKKKKTRKKREGKGKKILPVVS